MQKGHKQDFGTVLSPEVVTVERTTSILEIARIMRDKNIGAVLVMEDDKIAGIISERDIVRRVVTSEMDTKKTKAEDVMTKDVTTAQFRDKLDKIMDIMCKAPFRHLPILDGDKLVGILSNRDLLYLSRKEE